MVDTLKDKCKFDSSKPSAIPQKLFDVAKLNNIGWKVKVGAMPERVVLERQGDHKRL